MTRCSTRLCRYEHACVFRSVAHTAARAGMYLLRLGSVRTCEHGPLYESNTCHSTVLVCAQAMAQGKDLNAIIKHSRLHADTVSFLVISPEAFAAAVASAVLHTVNAKIGAVLPPGLQQGMPLELISMKEKEKARRERQKKLLVGLDTHTHTHTHTCTYAVVRKLQSKTCLAPVGWLCLYPMCICVYVCACVCVHVCVCVCVGGAA